MKHDDLDMELQNVAKFFGNDLHFVVPHYQRNYAWESDHVQQMIEDLDDAMTNFPDDVYLLGQVLVCPSAEKTAGLDSDVQSFELIDGQQRATTLYLLFLLTLDSLDDEWVNIQNPGNSQKLSMWRSLKSLPNNNEPTQAIARLRLASGNSAYWTALLAGEGFPAPASPTEHNLLGARSVIEDFLEAMPSNEERYNFLRFLMNQVSLIKLILPSAQHALRMFMKINNRGMKLDPSDIIKSYIFQEARAEDYADISRKWSESQDLLFSKARLSRVASMQFLMKALIGLKTGRGIRGDQLFTEWEKYFKEHGDGNAQNNVQIVAQALPEWANRLARISRRETPLGHKTTDFLRGAHEIKAVQHFEVLMAGSALAEGSYDTLSRVVEDRIMLSSWAKEKNGLLENVIHPWAYETQRLESTASKIEILGAANKALRPDYLQELFDAAYSKLRRGLSYSTQSHHSRIRYFLARVNQEVQSRFQVAKPSVDDLMMTSKNADIGFDLDHVFPKAEHQTGHWVQSSSLDEILGEGSRVSRSINSIGNLVLLHSKDNKFNADALPSEEAKGHSYTSSELYINKMLTPAGMKAISQHAPHAKILQDLSWPEGLKLDGWNEDSTEALFDFYWGVMKGVMVRNFGL